MILRSIVLFESARRLLGHDAVLSWEQVEALPDDWQGALFAYADLVLQRQDDATDKKDRARRTPIVPMVDIVRSAIVHYTGTGHTRMEAREDRVSYVRLTDEPDSKIVVRDLMEARLDGDGRWMLSPAALDAVHARGMPRRLRHEHFSSTDTAVRAAYGLA